MIKPKNRFVLACIVLTVLLAIGGLYYTYALNQDKLSFESALPNKSDADIIAWSRKAAQQVMDFNAQNVDDPNRLQQVSTYFTSEGWESFKNAFDEAHSADAAKSLRLAFALVETKAPEIVSAAVEDGKFTWTVKYPVLIRYTAMNSANQKAPMPFNGILTLKIVPSSFPQNPDGIAMTRWVLASSQN